MNSREEKIALLYAIAEKERREKAGPLLHYTPHAGQVRAIQAKRDKRVVIVGTGNRWGKSTWNAVNTICHVYGYYIYEVPNLQLTPEGDYPQREDVPNEYWTRRGDGLPTTLPAKGLLATGLNWKRGIGETMWPKIESLLPEAVKKSKNFNVRRGSFGVPVEFTLPNGGHVAFGSGDQDSMQFEAADFTFAGIDEPPKRAIFGAIWRGLTDHYGPLWMSMTPIGPNAPWVFEEFELKERDDTAIIRGSIWENPHITDDAKKEFLEGGGFLEEERAARESGAWTFLTHRAFPMFDPAAHVVPPQDPPTGWIKGLAIDPAHRRPYALLWAAFGPDGEVLVYDEWPNEPHAAMRSSSFTVKDYVDLIIRKEGTKTTDFKCLDPRFGAAQPRIKGERHSSIQDDFASFDMFFDCRLDGTEREEIGIGRIRDLLHWDRKSPVSPTNRPKLRVCSNCTNTMDALALRNFVPPSMRDPDILPEKMMEQHKDFCDALRYVILYPALLDFDRDYPGYLTPRDLQITNDDNGGWF